MFLALVMIFGRNEKRAPFHKFIAMLSVFVTDKEYDAADFENEPCLFEEIGDPNSIGTAKIAHYAEAVLNTGDQKSLSVRSDRDIGPLRTENSLRSWFSFVLVRMPIGKLVRIEKKYLNFKLISVRIPYSIVWYFICEALEIIGGYKGADDIDKRLIWLALVSILTELVICYIPGPSVVIKTNNENKTNLRSLA